MSKKDSSHSSRMLKILPPILTVALVLLCIYIGSRMSIQGLISYTPSNVLLAAAGILALFAVKSLSVIFPLSVPFGLVNGSGLRSATSGWWSAAPFLICWADTSVQEWWSSCSANIPSCASCKV